MSKELDKQIDLELLREEIEERHEALISNSFSVGLERIRAKVFAIFEKLFVLSPRTLRFYFKKNQSRQYLYRIFKQDYPESGSCILTIQNTQTMETRTIALMQLANNMDLLSQFSPQDIFMVAYAAAHEQLLHIKKWLQNQPQ